MARGLIELLVGGARPGRLHAQAHFANDLALLQLRGEHVDEEAVEVDIPFTTWTERADSAAQSERHSGQVARRIGVGQSASQGALGAHHRVAHFMGGLGEHGRLLVDLVRKLDVAIGGHRADGQISVFSPNVRQAWDAADVHEQLGLGEAQLHQRQQAVAAGQHFRFWIFEQSDRLLKFGREHGWSGTPRPSGRSRRRGRYRAFRTAPHRAICGRRKGQI